MLQRLALLSQLTDDRLPGAIYARGGGGSGGTGRTIDSGDRTTGIGELDDAPATDDGTGSRPVMPNSNCSSVVACPAFCMGQNFEPLERDWDL